MPTVLVQIRRRGGTRAGLLPGHPQNEHERDRWKYCPRHLGNAAWPWQVRILPRDDRGSERRPQDEHLRHDNGRDAGDKENRGEHARNLTRLASTAGDDRPV